ncbi:MAG: helical backbone metal receptor [Bacteroidota bacterium]
MPFYRDQLGRPVNIHSNKAIKIVSLVPSQTELLYYLGLEKEVIGITKFCVRPQIWVKEKTIVGGTKNIKIDKIEALQPNLIIANKEENDKKQIEALSQKYPVWISDIQTLTDAFEMIREISMLVQVAEKGENLIATIQSQFETLAATVKNKCLHSPRAAYFIWRDPMIVVGKDTFIADMIQKAGFQNVFEDNIRYPRINEESLRKADPEIILLSSEPFPFKEKHIQEFQAICPNAKIKLVDGEMFSWYGSRLLHTAPYLRTLI